MTWLEAQRPRVARRPRLRAWHCFLPFGEDPHRYAMEHAPRAGSPARPMSSRCSSRCAAAASELRQDEDAVRRPAERRGRRRTPSTTTAPWCGATASRGTSATATWPTPSTGSLSTSARASKGLVWEHNTHVGDARATDMAAAGMVNVGQLLRERQAADAVALVGFACHRGTVLAASSWGEPEQVFTVPDSAAGQPRGAAARDAGRAGRARRSPTTARAVALGPAGPPGDRGRLPPAPRGRQLRADADRWALRRPDLARAHDRPPPPAPRAADGHRTSRGSRPSPPSSHSEAAVWRAGRLGPDTDRPSPTAPAWRRGRAYVATRPHDRDGLEPAHLPRLRLARAGARRRRDDVPPGPEGNRSKKHAVHLVSRR